LEAAITDLLTNQSLTQAQSVVVSGCSAGGKKRNKKENKKRKEKGERRKEKINEQG
jgi:hypothetical protein